MNPDQPKPDHPLGATHVRTYLGHGKWRDDPIEPKPATGEYPKSSWQLDCERLQEQLAAERETLVDALKDLIREVMTHEGRERAKAALAGLETTDPATGETITKPSWAELGAMNQELQQLRQQLAAEREVGHNTAVALAQQITQLEDQLAKVKGQ